MRVACPAFTPGSVVCDLITDCFGTDAFPKCWGQKGAQTLFTALLGIGHYTTNGGLKLGQKPNQLRAGLSEMPWHQTPKHSPIFLQSIGTPRSAVLEATVLEHSCRVKKAPHSHMTGKIHPDLSGYYEPMSSESCDRTISFSSVHQGSWSLSKTIICSLSILQWKPPACQMKSLKLWV